MILNFIIHYLVMKPAVNTNKTQTNWNKSSRNSFIILTIVLFISIFAHLYISNKMNANERKEIIRLPADCSSSVELLRDNHHKDLTRSLYIADATIESSKYNQLKERLLEMILANEKGGKIQNVSLLLINLNDASRMSINEGATYFPGSMIKVPIMICCLKEEQEHPGFLKSYLYFDKAPQYLPDQKYQGFSIKPGKKYSVEELLKYMIEDSDNNATYLLISNIQVKALYKIFTDLMIPDADKIETDTFRISVEEYSKFFRVLYNATYINKELSEFALSLLSKSKFREGLTKSIPTTVTVAHKFGEKGQYNILDFSESGIIYYKNSPYLLTIMTGGTNVPTQAEMINILSGEIFRYMSQN